MCRERRFRQDLFYRLNVLSVQLRPLRERPEAVQQIALATIEKLCQREGKSNKALSGHALAVLKSYPWPGNIRELENVLERAVAFSESSEIYAEDLRFDSAEAEPISTTKAATSQPDPVFTFAGKTLDEIERLAIIATLEACDGNKAKSARTLGISEKSIYNKMRRLSIGTKKGAQDDNRAD